MRVAERKREGGGKLRRESNYKEAGGRQWEGKQRQRHTDTHKKDQAYRRKKLKNRENEFKD